MKCYVEKSLRDFDFWSGAVDTVEELTCEELDILETIIEETFFDKMPSKTEINDFVWFERDYIAERLGYNSFDEIIERNSEEEDNEED